MKINTADFIISAVGPSQYPEDALPEIALAGRSNVGKSSFINKMLNRKNIARTSSRPGKTQTLNFFEINKEFYFVDVPGYGFAKVSKTEKEKWGEMIEEYLTDRDSLRAIVQLIDLRHAPTADDKIMYDFLKFYQLPVIIIATKADKISKGKWQRHLKVVQNTLGVGAEDRIVLFSSESGQGRDEAWRELLAKIKAKD